MSRKRNSEKSLTLTDIKTAMRCLDKLQPTADVIYVGATLLLAEDLLFDHRALKKQKRTKR
jgi:hypothetical protein